MTGNMRHRITFKQETGEDGEENPKFATWREGVPANVVPVGGAEGYRGRQLEGTITHVIETRYFPGILPSMQIYDEGREVTYDVIKVIEVDGRRHRLEIHATERVL